MLLRSNFYTGITWVGKEPGVGGWRPFRVPRNLWLVYKL